MYVVRWRYCTRIALGQPSIWCDNWILTTALRSKLTAADTAWLVRDNRMIRHLLGFATSEACPERPALARQ